MGQEFFVKSQNLEQKVRELLPSQGGLGAGFDLSASSQIIPVIDLTEAASGANVRQDLQTAFSFNDITAFSVSNTKTTIVNTTGYYRVYATVSGVTDSSNRLATFGLNDGASDKEIQSFVYYTASETTNNCNVVDFIVFLPAGHSLYAEATSAKAFIIGCTKQIADINGTLTEPS